MTNKLEFHDHFQCPTTKKENDLQKKSKWPNLMRYDPWLCYLVLPTSAFGQYRSRTAKVDTIRIFYVKVLGYYCSLSEFPPEHADLFLEKSFVAQRSKESFEMELRQQLISRLSCSWDSSKKMKKWKNCWHLNKLLSYIDNWISTKIKLKIIDFR